jgi:hypothetical protein
MKTLGDTLPRRFKAKASGSITAGKPCIVEADGDVAQVAVSAAATGSATTFESGNTDHLGMCYDTANDKIVIAYKDESNSDYGTAVVGTVSASDNSISFGTPVVFNSGESKNNDPVFDTNAGKVLIIYRDSGNSNYGTAIVGTVSGTSISFGSEAVFESANTVSPRASYDENAQKTLIVYSDYDNGPGYGTGIVATISGTSVSFGTATVFNSVNYTNYIGVAYDANAQKHLVVYRDNNDDGESNVATISGTSVSFGSQVEVTSNNAYYNTPVYDSSAQKVVVAFADFSDSNKGKAVVGTISGTSVSYGSIVQFEDGSTAGQQFGVAYDTVSGKVVISYKDVGNSNYATHVVGTVSGTSISFESPVVYIAESSDWPAAAYDPDQQRVVLGVEASNIGKALVFKPSSTNLTSENYIGIAEYAAADTETATVLIKGGVSTTQSSLTPGQTYFVQTDGTIGTSAGTPSVTAGTAVTSTKLIVKG